MHVLLVIIMVSSSGTWAALLVDAQVLAGQLRQPHALLLFYKVRA
jgi:hypothetical protein